MKKYFTMVYNILIYVLIYLALQFVSGFIAAFYYVAKFYNSSRSTEQMQSYVTKNIYIPIAIAAFFTSLIYIGILKSRQESLWERCKFNIVSFNNTLMIILLATGTVAVTSSLVNVFQYKVESYKTVSTNLSLGLSSLGGLLCVVIFIPIFEEILFRGLVFNELKKTLNIVFSIVIQGMIFGVFHGNLIQGIYTFFLGVILSILYIWLDSIWAPIICHVTFNLMGTLIFPILIYASGKYSFIYTILGLIALLYGLVEIKRFYNDKKRIIY